MGILDEAEVPSDMKPVIVTILGDAGRGKTTLAAAFPKPIVIRLEDGLEAIPLEHRPKALPLVSTVGQLWEQLTALLREEHDYQTVIVDSVSAAESLFIEHVLETDTSPKKPRSPQQAHGGYGAGWDAVSGLHGRLRKAAGLLADQRGMNTVFIAHADTVKVEPPNEDAYMSYSLRLNKKCLKHYVDDVNCVGFLRLDTTTIDGDGDRKKVITDGSRVLVCYATAENVSKNRLGITKDLLVKPGQNPLEPYIPYLMKQKEMTK